MKSFQMGSTLKQSGPQDQKNVIFSHSVISLNQLPQNFKNTAHIFLTSRNHVKIFLSGYFHNVSNIVYRTTLRIRTERADKTVKTLIRLLLEEQSDQGLYYLSFYLLHLHMILQGNLNLLNFRIFSILIQVFQFLEVSIWKKFECRKWLLWAVTVRIIFLLDQAGNLKIRWNLALYARL